MARPYELTRTLDEGNPEACAGEERRGCAAGDARADDGDVVVEGACHSSRPPFICCSRKGTTWTATASGSSANGQ
jgi:hypothetical protein